MTDTSIGSLVHNSASTLAVSCLLALWLLSWIERRRLACFSKLMLAITALGLFTYLGSISAIASQRIVWALCAGLSAVLTIIAVNQWRSLQPRQIYQESKLLNPKKLKASKGGNSLSLPTNLASWISLLSALTGLLVLCLVRQPEVNMLRWSVQSFAILQLASTALMIGVCLFLCLELTLISTPDALNVTEPNARVNWAVVSRLTMAIGLVSVACCLAQIWLGSGHQQLGEFSSDSAVQIAARLFGLMQLLSTFTVWMVSHRLANYQRQNLFPKDWVSLTLTAWLGLMAFVVIASLPTEWPWLTLIK